MNYVNHICKNKQCNNTWIDKDITNAKSYPPNWKYCKECCKKLGIDFDSQTHKSKLSKEEIEKRKNRLKNYWEDKQKNKS